MTYLEKLMEIHPEMSADELAEFIIDHCPDGDHGLGVADVTCVDGTIKNACPKCWNREIPGTGPTGDLSDLQKAIEKVQACVIKSATEDLENMTRAIKDSGERRQFDTGAVRDIQEGKGRCDLMPLDVVAWVLGGHDDNKDSVLDSIDQFMTTNTVGFLYDALEYFRNLWGIPTETMFLEVAKHFEEGAKKYGEHNWQKGIPVRCYIDSAVRHYLKWLRGDKDEPHDRAFCWNILCAIWTCKHKPELNDYAPKQNENTCVSCGEVIPEGRQACHECEGGD